MRDQKLRVNQRYSRRSVPDGTTVLWHASTGEEVRLSAKAVHLISQFMFARNPREVIEEIAAGDSTIESTLRSSIAALCTANVLIPLDQLSEVPRDLGSRGAFGALSMPIDAAVSDRHIDAVIVGVEYDAGASAKGGSRTAPDSLRQVSASIFAASDDSGMYDPTTGGRLLEGMRLSDAGNLGAAVQTRNGHVLDELAAAAQAVAEAGKLFVAIGGDHSITHAIVRGYLDAGITRLGILHFDAHSDYFEPLTGDWRASLHHGNVMSWIRGHEEVTRIAQFGIRQLTADTPSLDDVVVVWPGRSALQISEEELDAFLDPDIAWHVTIDVDVLDPTALPSTGTPLPGGFAAHELSELVRRAMRGRNIVGIDMVELIGGSSDPSSLVAADVLLRAIGAALTSRSSRL